MSEITPRDLDTIRADIDAIDAELLRNLNRRVELAQEIGALKGTDGQPFFTPERERAIFQRLAELNDGPMRRDQLLGIFREIISAARAAERLLKVAYWGPKGSFSNLAALKTFGSNVQLEVTDSIRDAFMLVEHQQADYAIVPIENSIAGVVPETLDMFPVTNVKICSEVFLSVHHCLLSTAGSLDEIEQVFAGPQPYGQTRHWLKENLPHAEIIEVVPTSRAAQLAVQNPKSAAVGNELSAEIYGLGILAEHIEDFSQNRTRFIVIGANEPTKTGNDKTTLMFTLRNRPGELYRALGAFVEHGVNLTMIESRPAQRSTFEYYFYCDCAGHRSDEQVRRALDMLRILTLETTILGSYPTAD